VFERAYPFAWLGVLAAVAPSSEEIVYASSERGFALHSMRTPELTRLYLQVAPEEPIEDWPDGRIWEELQARLATDDGWTLDEGPILDKGVTGMGSFVVEPMASGGLFLSCDPPAPHHPGAPPRLPGHRRGGGPQPGRELRRPGAGLRGPRGDPGGQNDPVTSSPAGPQAPITPPGVERLL